MQKQVFWCYSKAVWWWFIFHWHIDWQTALL